jgi:hypothetical protein
MPQFVAKSQSASFHNGDTHMAGKIFNQDIINQRICLSILGQSELGNNKMNCGTTRMRETDMRIDHVGISLFVIFYCPGFGSRTRINEAEYRHVQRPPVMPSGSEYTNHEFQLFSNTPSRSKENIFAFW